METLAISIAHTTIQRDRARESYDEAAIRQDKQGVAEALKRMKDCEEALRGFKEKMTRMDEERYSLLTLEERFLETPPDEQKDFIARWLKEAGIEVPDQFRTGEIDPDQSDSP